MRTDLQAELRAAFESATEPVTPRPDLAERVRQSARRRTRRVAVVSAATAAVSLLIALTGLLAAGRPGHPGQPARPHGPFRVAVDGVDALAVGGKYLYVAAGDNPGAALSAYDRITGRLVARVPVPASISDVAVGPDGFVWLAFYPDQNGGSSGLWLLSPNLRLRSTSPVRDKFGQAAVFNVLPIGATRAWLATDGGLASIDMPRPGSTGRPAISWRPLTTFTTREGYVPEQVADLSGRVVVKWGRDAGPSIIRFQQHSSPAFTKGGHTGMVMAAQGGGLWVSWSAPGNFNGPLIRLNGWLRVATPRAIAADPLLRSVENVWVFGHTVWVQTSSVSQPLACFSYRGGTVSQVGVLRDPGYAQPAAGLLTVSGDTAYVEDSSYVNNGMGPEVTGYAVVGRPVPAVCR